MSELYHHQIKGAKHGVRNGPPYPLDPEDHTAEQLRLNPDIRRELKEKKTAAEVMEKVKRRKAEEDARNKARLAKANAKAQARIIKTKARIEKNAKKALTKGNDDKLRKKAESMTEEELNAKIKRLDLEKRYISLEKDLTPAKKQRESVVRNMISGALKNIGTQALTAIAGEAWNRIVDNSGHPEYKVNPKKGQKDK